MRRNMRRLAMILCLILAVTVLITGCTQKAPAPEEKEKTADTNKAESQAKPADTKKEPPLKIKGMANLFNQAPPKDGDFWRKIEQEFNVDYDVDWIPSDNYQQKLELILASGDLPDVMQVQQVTAPSVLKAIAAGAFWDMTSVLGDFSKYPNFKEFTNPNAWKYSKVKGKNYSIPRTRGHLDSCLFIREDWLTKLNLRAPTTMEELANVIKVIAQADPDENGKVDTIGIFPNAVAFSAAFGTRDPVYDADGGIVHMNLSEGYAQYVAFMRDLYEAGAVAKEFAMIKGQQQEELFMTGRSATFYKNSWHKFRMEQETNKVQPGAKVKLLPYMEGPKGYAHTYDLGYYGGMVISNKLDEDKKMKILDFFHATVHEKYYNLVNFGIEGIHWTMQDGFPLLTEQGKKEVTNSFNAPFIFATNEFAKVDSPLAPVAYNLQTREEMKELYKIEGKIDLFAVLQSDTWAVEWSKVKSEFETMEAKAISGVITMDEFIAYQQKLKDNPQFKKAFKEFAQSYEEFYGKK